MKIKPEWLTQEKMAASCNMSISGFRKWGVKPAAKIGRCVYYSPADVTANRLAHRAASASGQNLLLRQEKLRLMRLRTEAQELKNKQLRERLIEVDLLRWTLEQTGKQIAEVIGEIPEALRKKCQRLTAGSHRIIRREIEKCQTLALQMAVNLDLDQFETN